MNDWQSIVDSDTLKGGMGITKGHKFIVMKSRGMGKSMFVHQALTFSSSWTKWEPEWTWKTRVSSRSGKIIWGRIMVRTSKYVVSAGKLIQQRATPAEALTQQKEAFKRALS